MCPGLVDPYPKKTPKPSQSDPDAPVKEWNPWAVRVTSIPITLGDGSLSPRLAPID